MGLGSGGGHRENGRCSSCFIPFPTWAASRFHTPVLHPHRLSLFVGPSSVTWTRIQSFILYAFLCYTLKNNECTSLVTSGKEYYCSIYDESVFLSSCLVYCWGRNEGRIRWKPCPGNCLGFFHYFFSELTCGPALPGLTERCVQLWLFLFSFLEVQFQGSNKLFGLAVCSMQDLNSWVMGSIVFRGSVG